MHTQFLQNKKVVEIATVNTKTVPIVSMKEWIDSQPGASYAEWEQRVTQKRGSNEASPCETRDVDGLEDDLSEEWLRNVMFSPSCSALRQVACSIVETICQV